MKNLERKLGKYAVPKLYCWIIGCMIAGYFLRYGLPAVYGEVTMIPYLLVKKNQYWRLFTWFLTIPFEIQTGSSSGILNLIFLPISLYFYYWISKRLEMTWGKFQFNLYVFGGALLTDILILLGAFFYYVWSPAAGAHSAPYALLNAMTSADLGRFAPALSLDLTYYMLISIFLAFTVIGGDNVVLLYFIIPLKMRWLGYLDLLWLLYYFVVGDFFTRIAVVASVVNYFLYALSNRRKYGRTLSDRRRQRQYRNAYTGRTRRPDTRQVPRTTGEAKVIHPEFSRPAGTTIHRCTICGRTEKDDPDLEFRYCSKCKGNYEYCMDHLYNHEHIR